jgi:hypothetical protein
MTIQFHPLPTDVVRAYQAGAPDALGNVPERSCSDGDGYRCRHCLDVIAHGAQMLLVAHCPFESRNPYAEVGPLFICAKACAPFKGTGQPPNMFTSPDFLLKGYTHAERIKYGTGKITPVAELESYAAQILEDADIAFVDVRSARNNCWQARITRAQP